MLSPPVKLTFKVSLNLQDEFLMNVNNKISILIIDDEQHFRLLVRKAFEDEGFNVIEAENGLRALTIVKQCIPHLILLDIGMPQMDGFEVCKNIRKIPQAEKIPVIMLTGMDDLISIRKAYDAGVTDYISKPVIWPWPILSHRVKNILEGYKAIDASQLNMCRLEHIEQTTEIGYWQWNCQNEAFEFNKKWAEILKIKHDRDVSYQRDFIKHINLHDVFTFKELVRKVIHTRESFSIQIRVKQGEGLYSNSYIWADVSCAVLEWDNSRQQAKQICGTLRQIIRPEQAEGPLDFERKITKEIAQQRDLYQSVISSMQNAIIILDEKNQILSMNTSAERLFGTTSTESLSLDINHYFPDYKKILSAQLSTQEQVNEEPPKLKTYFHFTGKTKKGILIQLNCQINNFQWNDTECCSITICL